MTAALLVLLMVAFGTSARGESSERQTAPSYSADSIVNSTTNQPGPFAPNTIVTIYGSALAYKKAQPEVNIRNLPDHLAGVRVLAMRGMGTPLPLHYVSPDQINFVLPDSLDPGEVDICVAREGTAGPVVRIVLQETAPALMSLDGLLLATHADGSLIAPDCPARPGEAVVLYATGLGRTVQRLGDGEIPAVPPLPLAGLILKNLADLRVMVAGEPLDPARVFYAGLTPGMAALYQINFYLPDAVPADPEIRIAMGEHISLEGLKLPLQP